MQNPFKVGDVILTKIKETEVEAAVTQIWKNEVQVRTPEGLLWRTMFTVWKRGEAPLQREAKVAKGASSAPATTATPKQAVTAPKSRRTAAAKKRSKSKRSQRRR